MPYWLALSCRHLTTHKAEIRKGEHFDDDTEWCVTPKLCQQRTSDITNAILDPSEFGKLWLSALFLHCPAAGFALIVVVSDGA